MISNEDLAAIVGLEPAMAFVRLEHRLRAELETKLEQSDNSSATDSYLGKYMNHTIATANALGLEIFSDWEVPDPNADSNRLWDQYRVFVTAMDNYSIQVQISKARQLPTDTVGLDDNEKRILRHYVEQIKIVIDEAKLIPAKRERLYGKINSFLNEVDKDRTPTQAISDVVIALAHTGGEAAKELEPAWKWVRLIGELMGARQENEQARAGGFHCLRKHQCRVAGRAGALAVRLNGIGIVWDRIGAMILHCNERRPDEQFPHY